MERNEVVSYRGTWVETANDEYNEVWSKSYLIEVRGLKLKTSEYEKSGLCRIL